MLDEFCAATGYYRKHATQLLRQGPPTKRPRTQELGRPLIYGQKVVTALQVAAEAGDWICGKRLVAVLPELILALKRERALAVSPAVRQSLLTLSAATIDRRLAVARRKALPCRLMTTKPGTLLKNQIPIRTYTPWDDERPGFVVSDIATRWTEYAAIPKKGQRAVLPAITALREQLLMALMGIDSDSGPEFINMHLLAYCRDHAITFSDLSGVSQERPAHVEQKNWSLVCHLAAYDQCEGAAACDALNRVYRLLHPYLNGYLHMMKLIGKEREGARVRKQYDVPRTPYRRVLATEVALPERRAALEKALAESGPVTLRHQIDASWSRCGSCRRSAKSPPRQPRWANGFGKID